MKKRLGKELLSLSKITFGIAVFGLFLPEHTNQKAVFVAFAVAVVLGFAGALTLYLSNEKL